MKEIHELYVALGDRAANGGIHEIINLISDQHYQFKVIGLVRGLWEENPDDTLLVQVVDKEQALEQTAQKLKEYLGTNAVWVQSIKDSFH